MTIKIEIQEIDNGFVLTLYDDEAPSDTDKDFYVKTMDETLGEIAEYYEKILQFRDTVEEEA